MKRLLTPLACCIILSTLMSACATRADRCYRILKKKHQVNEAIKVMSEGQTEQPDFADALEVREHRLKNDLARLYQQYVTYGCQKHKWNDPFEKHSRIRKDGRVCTKICKPPRTCACGNKCIRCREKCRITRRGRACNPEKWKGR